MKKLVLLTLLSFSSTLYAGEDCTLKTNTVKFGSMSVVKTATICRDNKTFIISEDGNLQQVLKGGFYSMEPVACDCSKRNKS